ncbi:alpha/beta fold hydrolase [Brevibacterium renqingii]|uniref:alpha/beta fold hydrolase n=1 Tax=Brevibacterium renqingii TaxID=2776916 RepID=UPI001ADEE05A|nr:alpha/beta hydrolase [Brevibacterium renqingii]
MSTVVSQDGTTIAYELHGDGPPVILVDGAMCYREAGPMRAIADQLQATHTVCLYDRRGRGESGDTLPYAPAREVEDIEALAEALGGRAALLGMSSGGALAVHAAAKLGAAVTHLLVYEPPFSAEPADSGTVEQAEKVSAFLEADDRSGAVAAFMNQIGMPLAMIEGMKESPEWESFTAIAPTLAYDNEIMADGAIPASASEVTAPTLALAGGVSRDSLRWGAEELARTVSDGRFETLEGQAHDVDPGVLAGRLVEFLEPHHDQ